MISCHCSHQTKVPSYQNSNRHPPRTTGILPKMFHFPQRWILQPASSNLCGNMPSPDLPKHHRYDSASENRQLLSAILSVMLHEAVLPHDKIYSYHIHLPHHQNQFPKYPLARWTCSVRYKETVNVRFSLPDAGHAPYSPARFPLFHLTKFHQYQKITCIVPSFILSRLFHGNPHDFLRICTPVE